MKISYNQYIYYYNIINFHFCYLCHTPLDGATEHTPDKNSSMKFWCGVCVSVNWMFALVALLWTGVTRGASSTWAEHKHGGDTTQAREWRQM